MFWCFIKRMKYFDQILFFYQINFMHITIVICFNFVLNIGKTKLFLIIDFLLEKEMHLITFLFHFIVYTFEYYVFIQWIATYFHIFGSEPSYYTPMNTVTQIVTSNAAWYHNILIISQEGHILNRLPPLPKFLFVVQMNLYFNWHICLNDENFSTEYMFYWLYRLGIH